MTKRLSFSSGLKLCSSIIISLIVISEISLSQILEAIPPSNPDIGIVPGDGFVKIYWNAKPESDIDAVLQALYPGNEDKWNNFEGYKIYKATDYEFEEIHTITDGLGRKRYYKPVAVFDKVNNIEGYFKGNSGLGIPLIFTNTSDNNFDYTLPPFYPDIQPMGMSSDLLTESSNGTWKLMICDSDTLKNLGQLIGWKIAFKTEGDTAYVGESTGGISDLNVVENSGFDQYSDGNGSSPLKWERYQPESMFFQETVGGDGSGSALKVSVDNFWDISTKNRIDKGDFDEAGDTTGWDQLLDTNSVNLGWVASFSGDSTGWLKMDVTSDTDAGIRWSFPISSQFDANSWVAFSIRVASENAKSSSHIYLALNDGSEKTFDLGILPADTTVLKYYRLLNNQLTTVSLYIKNADGATVYIDEFRASPAEYLTQEVYQRLPRVVPGSNYVWKTKIHDNNPGISITPGYRAYLPNEGINEYTQHGIERTSDKAEYQYFTRSFTAPDDTRDGIFYYTVDVVADSWTGAAEFVIDSLEMIGNSKWGLNLYPEISSSINVSGAISSWDDFKIELDISHPWLYELDIKLESPSGAIYSLMDGEMARSYLDGTYGIAQYMGSNSGLEYTYIDTSVNNGQRYFYAVVAYDHGDSLYNVLPSEGIKNITIEDDQFVFDSNTAMAIPNPYVKGYEPPKLSQEGVVHQGPGTGNIDLEIVDVKKVVNNGDYKLFFYDSTNDTLFHVVNTKDYSNTVDYCSKITTAYGIVNLTTGDTLMNYNSDLTQPSPVFDGLRIRLDNESRIDVIGDSVIWYGSDLSHPELLVNLSDLGGNRFPVRYRITFYDGNVDTSLKYRSGFTVLNEKSVNFTIQDMIENKPVKFAYRSVTGVDDFIIYPLFADTLDTVTNTVNFPYKSNWYIKLIFEGDNLISAMSADKGGLFYWQDTDSTVSFDHLSGSANLPLFKTGEATLLFWAADLAPSPTAPKNVVFTPDSSFDAGLYYFRGYMKSTSPQTVTLVTANGDTSISVTESYTQYTVPIELSEPGTISIEWVSIGDDTLWVYDISIKEKYRYNAGDYFIVPTTIQFRSSDIFQFETQAASTNLTSADSWGKFSVVPNPYVVSASWSYSSDLPGNHPDKISFINVPGDARIRLFTVRGDLVTELDHAGDIFDGTINWDLKNRSGKNVAYGIYIYHIESKSIGNKTGKLAIIR
ncbi:MAG: hypothetical protein KAU06_06080 [Candidatus Marinimicrobia bacterium]|nr:hypothetical protein [Candidatus Neomarinimicrobiota bacterium]